MENMIYNFNMRTKRNHMAVREDIKVKIISNYEDLNIKKYCWENKTAGSFQPKNL